MKKADTEEFARFVAKLIRSDPRVRQAIRDYACQCPNLAVEY